MAWAGSVKLPALSISRLWFNSRMSSCHVDGPGVIPGSRTNSSQVVRQHAAESPKLRGGRALAPIWQKDILLVNHGREIKRAGSALALPARAISTKNKHLLAIYSIPTRGFTAALSVFRGTPPPKPLDCKIWLNTFGALLCDLWR